MILKCCARPSFIPGTEAPPRSIESIARQMWKIRRQLAKSHEPINIELALDYCTSLMDASFDVVSPEEYALIPNSEKSEALWDGVSKTIYIPSDLTARLGVHRSRYTQCHELVHMLLEHKPPALLMGRGTPRPREQVPIYQDPEWQADKGAEFLLMDPIGVLSLSTINPTTVSLFFNVSRESAACFLADLERIPAWRLAIKTKAQKAATF
ncbi:MAG: hypothetical protein KH037_10480 [Burkholderiales bacterium]|nr:hypothetical protein [Burkholderiales bacterium]